MKIAVQNADCVFVAYTKIIEGCNFVALLTFNQCQLAEVDKSHRVTAWQISALQLKIRDYQARWKTSINFNVQEPVEVLERNEDCTILSPPYPALLRIVRVCERKRRKKTSRQEEYLEYSLYLYSSNTKAHRKFFKYNDFSGFLNSFIHVG